MLVFVVLLITACGILFGADPALATQSHSGPEGLVVHQIAHLFFVFSMGILVYWLRLRRLTVESGWRFIQYAAVLLIIWNIDAFAVHLLDEATEILDIQRLGNWHIQIRADSGYEFLELVYYLIKLDHVWCVPALVLLYMGLRRLTRGDALKESKTGLS